MQQVGPGRPQSNPLVGTRNCKQTFYLSDFEASLLQGISKRKEMEQSVFVRHILAGYFYWWLRQNYETYKDNPTLAEECQEWLDQFDKAGLLFELQSMENAAMIDMILHPNVGIGADNGKQQSE